VTDLKGELDACEKSSTTCLFHLDRTALSTDENLMKSEVDMAIRYRSTTFLLLANCMASACYTTDPIIG